MVIMAVVRVPDPFGQASSSSDREGVLEWS